jgi:hypothetical protein
MLERFRAMVASGRLRVRIVRGRMVVELPAGILFPSGEYTLSPEGQQTLTEVAQVLRTIEARDFQIAGHTDNQPLTSRRIPRDNWDLATLRAVEVLHRYGMLVVGGLIVGNPGDTRESIEANLDFARKYVDWPYIQHPTPYPGTPMTQDFREKNLIVNEAVEEYDGTTAVVRTEHLDAEEIEFMRWRAERWMKCRHLPSALAHDPLFVMTHWPRMLGHTFRGSSWRTWLGLESEREAFRRYKAIRRREREFFPESASGPGTTAVGRSGLEAAASSQTAAGSALRM